MKAFLSHATDKPFVELVAKYLGREYIVYDVYSFDHGEGFKAEIARGLGKSNIFVFFLSRASLKSFWVDLELDQAQRKLFDHDISKAIAIRLDRSIAFEELPHWLRRNNAPFIDSPAIAARLIKEHINALKRESTPDLLIGRTADIARVEQALTPSDHRPPGIVALWGLPGIGRRAVAKRVLRDILDLQRPLAINIEPGDGIADLRLKLAAYLDTPKDSDEYKTSQQQADSAIPNRTWLHAFVTSTKCNPGVNWLSSSIKAGSSMRKEHYFQISATLS
jgi:TIR domain